MRTRAEVAHPPKRPGDDYLCLLIRYYFKNYKNLLTKVSWPNVMTSIHSIGLVGENGRPRYSIDPLFGYISGFSVI